MQCDKTLFLRVTGSCESESECHSTHKMLVMQMVGENVLCLPNIRN